MIDWTKVITVEDKFEQKRQAKFNEIGVSFNEYVKGSFVCSLGYPMQFNENDALKMEGAIQLLTANNIPTGYLTDANDVTYYNVPLADIQAVKLEMLAAFAEAHLKKQQLRESIINAKTEEELERIQW